MGPKIHVFFLVRLGLKWVADNITWVWWTQETRNQMEHLTWSNKVKSQTGDRMFKVYWHTCWPLCLSFFSIRCLVCLYSCPCLLLVYPLTFYVTAYMSPLSIPESGSVWRTGCQTTTEQRKHTQTHAAVHSAAVRLQTRHIRNWRKEKQAAVERDGEGNRGEGGAGSGWGIFTFVCVSKLCKQTGPWNWIILIFQG